ncbi:uncharacterized protein LOC113306111 [Papaver somniferum]|uniref:uncharacterized protein LOC113306111 n=1 Tax=Papaver somniferum TaxID=3469 RepID=UPI000E7050F3|nr:uncharacterized protein LOC113306111 [Papaver somniferum]
MTWNIELINSFFTLENAQKIANIRIPFTGDDRLVWLHTKNGEFSVKTCYKALYGEINYLHNPHPSQPTYKALWSFPTLHKIHLFLWKCIENALPTGVRLSQYRNQVDTCCLCDTNSDESAEHLFLHCDYAKTVWEKLSLVTMQLQGILQTQVLGLAWCIWRDRCFKTFQNQTVTPLSIANHALKLLADTDACMPAPIVPLDRSVVPIQSPDNSGLPEHCRILYGDASYEYDTNEEGSGPVLTDLTGSFEGCKIIKGVARSAEEAECIALIEGIKWKENKGITTFCIRSDAKSAINYFKNNNHQLCWFNQTILDDCRFILNNFPFSRVDYVNRIFISIADKAAKHCRRNNVTGEWTGEKPDFLLDL